MGFYSEYLNSLGGDFGLITAERKTQLKTIERLRDGRNVLVIASDYNKPRAPIIIDYSDLLPVADQIDNITNNRIDVILETPGGSGETAEDIVKLLRKKFNEVNFIIPGWCKSAGTIIAMSGDEIIMDEMSALGPIDAQITTNGKTFSAHAFLEGLDKIKQEVIDKNELNRAYIPILQGISPGEIQHCQNALDFAKNIVSSWLEIYKFGPWDKHSSNGQPVTPEEKKQRATEIADELCNHSLWLSHGRSIKIDDLTRMRLRITDLNEHPELKEAVRRYYSLLRMSFENTNIYKLYETVDSQVYRFAAPPAPPVPQQSQDIKRALLNIECNKCKTPLKVQGNFTKDIPLEQGYIMFPANNILNCPNCGNVINLIDMRKQIEAQTGKKFL